MMSKNRISIRESLYTVTLLALLALLGTGFLGNITAVHAQSAATCGRQDTDQVQDESTATDATEPNCPETEQGDSGVCVLIGAEPKETTDPAGADEQVGEGNQVNEANAPDGTEQANTSESTNDGDQVQDPAYVGSLKVDEPALQTMPDAGRCNALKTMAKITVEAAQGAVLKANVGSVVDMIELDVENGYLVYSVQLKDGRDVKVDAGNGSILATQAADSSE